MSPSIAPNSQPTPCQCLWGQGWELQVGSLSQRGMGASLWELNPSNVTFELLEPQTLPARFFSPSRLPLGFLSGGTERRGAKGTAVEGESAGSHPCLGQGEHSRE